MMLLSLFSSGRLFVAITPLENFLKLPTGHNLQVILSCFGAANFHFLPNVTTDSTHRLLEPSTMPLATLHEFSSLYQNRELLKLFWFCLNCIIFCSKNPVPADLCFHSAPHQPPFSKPPSMLIHLDVYKPLSSNSLQPCHLTQHKTLQRNVLQFSSKLSS